jgi:phospholipid/cholesterol/gamma-HCH transport system substrate-binding protein
MKTNLAATGVFVISAVLLFGAGLFLIGNRENAFSHHHDFYTEMSNVNGLAPGSKVRVSGFDAGQVTSLQIPDRPSEKFRIKLHVDKKLNNLIREDSVVTVESDGIVGDKFLLIHDGSDQSPEAKSGDTLPSKEPVEISAMLEKASGVLDQASATIGDVHIKLNLALDNANLALNNTNGILADARNGKGTVGLLLKDQATADQVKQVVANADQASANLNQASVQVKQIVADVQSRNLPAKMEDSLINIRHASGQVNNTLTEALGPDHFGTDAGGNIRDSLSNVNQATSNLADDTEALKHEFFFRGFFKKRGFYSLQGLTPEQYRSNVFFDKNSNYRAWLNGDDFAKDSKGNEILSPAGRLMVAQVLGNLDDSAINQPMVIEGYSTQASGVDQLVLSRSHMLLVAHYLELHFHLNSKNIGVIPLNATPPPAAGKSTWDGACIVILAGTDQAKSLDAKRHQEQHGGAAEPIATSAVQPRQE